MIKLVYPSLPADGQLQWERAECAFVPGQTLDRYINLPLELIELVVYAGAVVERDQIALCTPNDGDEIHVVPKMAGKNKALIAGILGAIVAVAFAEVTGGGSLAWYAALQAAATGYAVGSSLAQLTSHPPRTKTDHSKAVPGFAGDTNGEVAGIAQPVVLGDVPKTYGVRVASFVRTGPYVDTNQVRSLSGTGSVSAGSNIVYGVGTKFTSEVSVGNNIQIAGNEIAVDSSGETRINLPESRLVTSVVSDTEVHVSINFTKAKSGAAMAIINDATNSRDSERSYQLINVSKAPWGIQAIGDVLINDQPLSNFPGATYAYTLGETPEQWYDQGGIPIARPEAFNVTANTFAQSQELTLTPYVYTTSVGVNCDAIELILAFPAGLVHTHNGSDQQNSTRYKVRYRLHGTSTWTPCAATGFDGSTGIGTQTNSRRTSFFANIRIDHLPAGRYDVEVTWVSADNVDPTTDAWKVFLVGVTEIQSDARTYPGYALLAVSALAIESLNGATPAIACSCKGIKVPWHDGTSWQAPTWYGPGGTSTANPIGRNPGWLMLELHRDGGASRTYPSGYQRWGLGLSDDRIDVPAWRSFAAKCDASVHVTLDTAVEYDEPMHQLDTTLDTQRPAVEVIRDLLATARAAPMMGGNGAQHSVFYDGADSITQVVTAGNMAGPFQPVYDFARRTNTFDVTFKDRDRGYDIVTRSVVNDHLVTTLGKKPKRESISLDGVTRWTQVLRDTQFALRKHEYLKTTCTFEMRTDAILWRVGQVIGIQHELPQWGYGGRVRLDASNSTTHVVTPVRAHTVSGSIYIIDLDGADRLVDMATKTYEVRVRLADGSAEDGQLRTVSACSVTSDGYLAVTVSVPFSSAPQYNDPIAFGELGKSVKPFRCIAITRGALSTRRVTCVEYNGTIYPPSGVVTTTDYSALPNFGAPPPPVAQCIAHEDLAQQNDRSNVSTVVAEWSRPANQTGYGFYRGADVEMSYDGKNFTFLATVTGTEYRWPSAPHEVQLWFRVTPYATNGRRNLAGSCVSAPIVCHGTKVLPANVSALSAVSANGSFTYSWNELGREYLYEIRAADAFWTGDDNPANGFIWRGRGNQFVLPSPSSRSVTLYIRALDASKNYSANTTSMTCTDSAPAAPTITAAARTKTGMRVSVTPPAGVTDLVSLYLHADTNPTFTPDASNRVAQVVSSKGGDFFFQTSNTATYYFQACSADYLSDRFADWIFSPKTNSSILSITPASPVVSAPAIGAGTLDKPRAVRGGAALSNTTAAVTSSQNTIPIVSTQPFPASGRILIDSEYCDYTSLDATNFLGVTRGVNGSSAASHASGAAVRGVPAADATVSLLQSWLVTVNWTFTDTSTNPSGSLIGFEIIIYSDDPTQPEFSATSHDPAQRRWIFTDLAVDKPMNLRAGVRALYIDGVMGAMVSSTGATLFDPTVQEPPIVTRDSAMTYPYQEVWKTTTLPTGITLGTGFASYSFADSFGSNRRLNLFSGGGTGMANAWIEWDIYTWADTYLDAKPFGEGVVILRCLVSPRNTGGPKLQVITDNGNGVVTTNTIVGFIDDATGGTDVCHNYSIPLGLFTFTGTSRVKVKLSMANVGAGDILAIEGLTLAIKGYGTILDGQIDKGLHAREQFLKIAPSGSTAGGGLVLTSPVQQPVSVDGNQLLVNTNGIFFSKAGGSALTGGFREGQRGDIGPITNGAAIQFDTELLYGGSSAIVRPSLPKPQGINKFRIMIEKKGASVLMASPAQYPVREWFEVTNFQETPGSGWRINDFTSFYLRMFFNSAVFFGGLYGSFYDDGPWSQSQTRKSALSLANPGDPGYGFLTSSGGQMAPDVNHDAWYYGKGLVPSTDANTIYYRSVIRIKVVMPDVRKTNGTPYYAALRFWISGGEGSLDATNNRMVLCDPDNVTGGTDGPLFRVQSDGGTYHLPCPISRLADSNTITKRCGGAALTPSQYYAQCFIVRYADFLKESGAPSSVTPTSVEIERVEFDYITPNGAQNPTWTGMSNEQFSYVTYNEF